MEIIYREAELSDSASLIEFLKTVGGETDNLSFSAESLKLTPESEERFLKRFKSNGKNLMLVAEYNGKIVGNASIERNKIPRFSHRAELSVAVVSEFWGRGIGSELCRRLIDFAKSTGAEIIYLEARADNERAISLYRKIGFKPLGIYENFFKINNKYYDAMLMTLQI